jgi:2-methylisocitrate lyase-like PEP mutase family enzyme
MGPGAALRAALVSGTTVVPGAFDALSAQLVEEAGFPAVVLGSFAIAAARGLPDLGLLSESEMLDTTRSVTRAVSIPAIADVDTGYNGGGTWNVASSVRLFEDAGAACLQIEDQVAPKKPGLTEGRLVVDVATMRDKIRSAVRARRSEDFLVMARTDARPIDEAIRRAKAYEDAGADVLYIEDYTSREDVERAVDRLKRPLVYALAEGAPMPWFDLAELRAMGVGIVYYPITTLAASIAASRRTLAELAQRGTTLHVAGELAGFREVLELTRDAEWRRK